MPQLRRSSGVSATVSAALLMASSVIATAQPTGDDATADAASSSPLVFVDARIFDGTGAPVVQGGVVIVRDGVISEVGVAGDIAVPDGANVIDLEGRFLLPGFVNAHGHVNPDGDRSSMLEQLDLYAYYGVTTVLSLGDEGEHMEGERWSAGLKTSRLLVSGPSLSPSSPEEARSAVQRVAALGVDWVKMHVNTGRGRELHPHVIRAAQEAGRPSAIHIEELDDAKAVVRAGASLLAHSVRDEPVDQELVDLMLERDVCLVPTFTRELSTFVYGERPDFFDDPFFLERAAPDDLDAFLTPQRRAQAQSPQAQYWREALPLAIANMRLLHEAGVGIAMGTDTGPSGRFQGYFEHLEMEMMANGGLAPRDVLVSSTGEAARCIGLGGVVGTVQPGVWADFVVLNADPLEDIRHTREIYGVWIAGNRIR